MANQFGAWGDPSSPMFNPADAGVGPQMASVNNTPTTAPTAPSPSGGGVLSGPTDTGGSGNGVDSGNGYTMSPRNAIWEGLDDGGMIGDEDTTSNAPVDPMAMVKNALSYGRKAMGLPATFYTDMFGQGHGSMPPDQNTAADDPGNGKLPLSQNIEDRRGMLDANGNGIPGGSEATPKSPIGSVGQGSQPWPNSYDDGGGVIQPDWFPEDGTAHAKNKETVKNATKDNIDPTNLIPFPAQPKTKSYDDGGGVLPTQAPSDDGQGTGQSLPDPRQTLKYLTGAGSVAPDVANALEQRADPQGQMSSAERTLAAIQGAGDPKSQFGLLQHYRGLFNGHNGAALAALKQGNIAQAAQSATQAFARAPTGYNVQFSPTQGGVKVHTSKIGQKQQAGFGYGGRVPEEDEQAPGVIPTDQSVIQSDGGVPETAEVSQGASATIPTSSFAQFLKKDWDWLVEKGGDFIKNIGATAAPKTPSDYLGSDLNPDQFSSPEGQALAKAGGVGGAIRSGLQWLGGSSGEATSGAPDTKAAVSAQQKDVAAFKNKGTGNNGTVGTPGATEQPEQTPDQKLMGSVGGEDENAMLDRITAQAHRIPFSSTAQRNAYIQNTINEIRKSQGQLANTGVAYGGRAAIANARNEVSTNNNIRTNQTRMTNEQLRAAVSEGNSKRAGLLHAMGIQAANPQFNPTDPTTMKQIQAMAAEAGMHPQDFLQGARLAIQNPQAMTQAPGQQQTQIDTPQIGTVRKGYRFNGGDPAQQGSWTKVQ